MSMPSTKIVLAGASGAIGQQLLQQLLKHPHRGQLQAWTRQQLPASSQLVQLPLGADFAPADVAICTLGTTIAQAGSQQAFQAVDLDLVVTFAKAARQAGCRRFIVVSSLGADATSRNFYLRVKGQMEHAVAALGFEAVHLVRPSLLTGATRRDVRLGEQFSIALSSLFSRLIPIRWRPVEVGVVGSFLLSLAKTDTIGVFVHENWEIHHHHAASSPH